MSLQFTRTLLGKQFYFFLQRREDRIISDSIVCNNVTRSYTITICSDGKQVSFHYAVSPFIGSIPLRVVSAFITFITDSIEGRTEEGLVRKYNTGYSLQIQALAKSMQERYNLLLERLGQPEDLVYEAMEAYHEMIIAENLVLLKSSPS